jgi:hypothetical protein
MPIEQGRCFSLEAFAGLFNARRRQSLVWLTCWLAIAANAQASDVQSSQIAGGVEAVIYICAPIDAKSARTGSDLLKNVVVDKKLDLVAVRKSDAYRSIYNSEVNRMLSMAPKDRLVACQTAF